MHTHENHAGRPTTAGWDVVVVGGGAAGLSAALMLGRARRRTVVVDAGSPRNRFAAHMHGVLGHEGRDPAELLARGRAEVAAYGVEVRPGAVDRLDETADGVRVTLADGSTLDARAAVVTTGISDDLPDVPGLAERWGTSVLHCPYCHGWEVRDRRLGVLTTSPLSLHQAELVRQWSDRVTVFTAGLGGLDEATERRLRARGTALVAAPVTRVTGGTDGALVVHTDDGSTVELDALFTGGTPRPHDGFLTHLGLERAESPVGSFLAVDATGRTSNERIWAAGNVVAAWATVPVAISAGAMAGAHVNATLVTADGDAAVATADAQDPVRFWEDRYAGADAVWSGRPNATLVDVVEGLDLAPGRALDLGCGEGGDAIWLGGRGFDVTGVDLSATAVRRATAAAAAAGLQGSVRFRAADVAAPDRWEDGDGAYDLVTACFFQSPVELPRTDVLRRAASFVAPGGHLVLVTHAAPPSWARPEDVGHHPFLTPQEELDALDLDPGAWDVLACEIRTRAVTSPDGAPGTLDDTLVVARRRAARD